MGSKKGEEMQVYYEGVTNVNGKITGLVWLVWTSQLSFVVVSWGHGGIYSRMCLVHLFNTQIPTYMSKINTRSFMLILRE